MVTGSPSHAFTFDSSGTLKEPTAAEVAAADSDSAIIVLNRGKLDDGAPYWAYIAVKPSRYREFIKATEERRRVLLEEYGAFLHYGYGEDVPESVREEMKSSYGFDENYVDNLTKKVKDARAAFFKQQENQRIDDIVTMLKKKRPADGAS